MIFGAEVEEIGVGEAHAIPGGVLFPEADDLFRIPVRERAEENAVDHAEDGGGGADTESQSQNGDGSESAGFFEQAEGEACVLEKSFEEWERTFVSGGFFGLLRTAELDEGLAAGFLR